MERIKAWFEDIGKVRDGLLLTVGLLYFLGFLTWGVYARLLNIGAAPALRTQYFAAGVPALVAIALMMVVFLLAQNFLFGWWVRWFNARAARDKFILVAVLFVVSLAVAIYVYGLTDDKPLPFTGDLANIWFELSLLFILIIATAMLMALIMNAQVERLGIYLMLIGEFLIFAYAGLVTFVGTVYVRWPQHFGGGAPICAEMDVYTARLSQTSLEELMGSVPDVMQVVVRTERVFLIFSGNTVHVLADENAASHYELRRDDIASIRWCNERDPL